MSFPTSRDVPAIPGAFHVQESVVTIDSTTSTSSVDSQQESITKIIREVFPLATRERIERDLRRGKAPDVILNELADEEEE